MGCPGTGAQRRAASYLHTRGIPAVSLRMQRPHGLCRALQIRLCQAISARLRRLNWASTPLPGMQHPVGSCTLAEPLSRVQRSSPGIRGDAGFSSQPILSVQPSLLSGLLHCCIVHVNAPACVKGCTCGVVQWDTPDMAGYFFRRGSHQRQYSYHELYDHICWAAASLLLC